MNHISLSITDNFDPLFQEKIFCVPEGDTTAEGGGFNTVLLDHSDWI